ncbi:hypothetical protein [Burkholderia glumae]|uniref:hypothetical protein n=1 Tax=Burkholderia glumae TaxID=337 RepID=UPI00148E936B|nr:hypothetical protein [Burkholderia glumae]QJW79761.1 hypothetical protein GAS18_14055 [Burkholderia glumae]
MSAAPIESVFAEYPVGRAVGKLCRGSREAFEDARAVHEEADQHLGVNKMLQQVVAVLGRLENLFASGLYGTGFAKL